MGRKELKIDVKQVEVLAAQGLNEMQIAKTLGINWKTLNARKVKYKAFSEALATGKTKGVAKITNALFNSAIGGSFQAQQFYLINRDKDNWQDLKNIDHTSKDGTMTPKGFNDFYSDNPTSEDDK